MCVELKVIASHRLHIPPVEVLIFLGGIENGFHTMDILSQKSQKIGTKYISYKPLLTINFILYLII